MEVFRPNPVRPLAWGLLCFAILMLFTAWAGIGELFVPPSSGPGIRFIDMPAPLLAFNLAICALPLAAFVLILAGVAGMVQWVAGVGPRLVWRIGPYDVTAVRVAFYLVIVLVLLFVGLVAAAYLTLTGVAVSPILGLAVSLTLISLPIALGWYLMLLAGWSLAPLARTWERVALRVAVAGACIAAAFLIGVGIAATLGMGSAALEADAMIPPRTPWADAISGTAGFAALAVLTLVAFRAARRYQVERPAAVTPTA